MLNPLVFVGIAVMGVSVLLFGFLYNGTAYMNLGELHVEFGIVPIGAGIVIFGGLGALVTQRKIAQAAISR